MKVLRAASAKPSPRSTRVMSKTKASCESDSEAEPIERSPRGSRRSRKVRDPRPSPCPTFSKGVLSIPLSKVHTPETEIVAPPSATAYVLPNHSEKTNAMLNKRLMSKPKVSYESESEANKPRLMSPSNNAIPSPTIKEEEVVNGAHFNNGNESSTRLMNRTKTSYESWQEAEKSPLRSVPGTPFQSVRNLV